MKKCECGKTIDDKYQYCQECSEKKKKAGTEEITDGLSKINNNLYFLRTAMATILKNKYGVEIVWDKEHKAFKEQSLKK